MCVVKKVLSVVLGIVVLLSVSGCKENRNIYEISKLKNVSGEEIVISSIYKQLGVEFKEDGNLIWFIETNVEPYKEYQGTYIKTGNSYVGTLEDGSILNFKYIDDETLSLTFIYYMEFTKVI